MNLIDILIIILISLWVVFAILYIVKCKKNGKCIGCDGCKDKGNCQSCKNKKEK